MDIKQAVWALKLILNISVMSDMCWVTPLSYFGVLFFLLYFGQWLCVWLCHLTQNSFKNVKHLVSSLVLSPELCVSNRAINKQWLSLQWLNPALVLSPQSLISTDWNTFFDRQKQNKNICPSNWCLKDWPLVWLKFLLGIMFKLFRRAYLSCYEGNN